MSRLHPGYRENPSVLQHFFIGRPLPVSLLEGSFNTPRNGFQALFSNLKPWAIELWAVPDADEWDQVCGWVTQGTALWTGRESSMF